MVFDSVLAAGMELSGTSLWAMVSILDLLHCFSFQFGKNDSAAM